MQRERSTFLASDKAEISVVTTAYLRYVHGKEKENIEPATYRFFRGTPPARPILAPAVDPRSLAKMRATQAQQIASWLSDEVGINKIVVTHSNLARF